MAEVIKMEIGEGITADHFCWPNQFRFIVNFMCTTFHCQVYRKILRSYKIGAKCVHFQLVNNERSMFLGKGKGPKHDFSVQILHKNWEEQWNFADLKHFDGHGSSDARYELKILVSWSLWVSIDLAWKDESIELHNNNLALFSVACMWLHPALLVGPSVSWLVCHTFFINFISLSDLKSFKSMSHSKSF